MADVIVIGAGAAGLMCAATAAALGRSVTVLEHRPRPGAKILVSGGGRCNFTNREAGAAAYLSANPHFCKSALARYTPGDFLELMARHGLTWHEKTLGQLFCDQRAPAILAMLEAACARAGVAVRTGVTVTAVEGDADGYRVALGATALRAPSLVIATGGLSLPKLGATPFGYQVAERFGLKVVPPRPGLVPLVWNPADREHWGDLAGVSAPATVRCGGAEFRESLLFTHRGLSGPAILQASSYWVPGQPVVIDLLPGLDAGDWLKSEKRDHPKADLHNVLAHHLPKRLADAVCAATGIDGRLATLADAALGRVADAVQHWAVIPAGTEGYRTAEVTVGGVDTAELSSKTMEAKKAPGLYFVGEVVDVTGWLGGYNFQWAWASGHAAGEAV